MQSVIFSFSAFSHIDFSDAAARRYGSRPIAHTVEHLPHLIQGNTSLRRASSAGKRIIPDVPLVTGTSVMARALPIIGPPLTTFPVSSGIPPAASIRLVTGVPILTRKLPGLLTDFPVTVTTLSIRGLFLSLIHI